MLRNANVQMAMSVRTLNRKVSSLTGLPADLSGATKKSFRPTRRQNRCREVYSTRFENRHFLNRI